MNTTPLELNRQDLFASPIYRGNDTSWLTLDKHVDVIIDNLKKDWKKRIKEGKDKQLPNSYHSNNLWQEEPFKPFVEFVMQQMWNILSWQGYNLKGKRPLLQECWVQEFPEEGGFHEIHIHSNNHMSGFYFLQCSEETSKPSFHDPRPGKMMTDLMPVDKKKVLTCTSQIHYPVKPGDFIFFNSYLPHAYNHYASKGGEKFRFIHFNMQATTDPGNVDNVEEIQKGK